jgi:hypothetical protein
MPDELKNLLKLFADDSKLIGTVRSNDDVKEIQSDLDKLCDWAKNSRMNFNIAKCKVMKIGKVPKDVSPTITLTMTDDTNNTHMLEEVSEEKDLGVVLQNNLKWNAHVNRACSTAYMKLGLLKRTFKTWSNMQTVKTLYTSFVRPHLEYAVPVWNALNRKDIKKIERVQKKATKMVPQLRKLCYGERLLNLGLTSLEERRVRGDMIQMFKIHKKMNNVDQSSLDADNEKKLCTNLRTSRSRRKKKKSKCTRCKRIHKELLTTRNLLNQQSR